MGAAELLRLMRDGHPRTKAELVQATGVPRSTLNLLLEQLVEDGFVMNAGVAESSGGRRPTRFQIDPDLMVVVAIDFGATHGSVALTDLRGQTISRRVHSIHVDQGPVPSLEGALEIANALLSGASLNWTDVLGVGTGVPGPVEYSKGVLNRPPIMPGWDGFDIPGFIRQFVGVDVPTFVDNDVNILTVGEHSAYWTEIPELLYVKVSTGIGAGLIQNGYIQRGAQGSAGDIGQVQVPHNADDRVLEQIAGASAIAKELSRSTGTPHTVQDLLRLVGDNDPVACHLLRDAGRSIGEVLAIVINLLNPAVVVIGGRLGAHSEDLTAGIREVVYKRATPLSTKDLYLATARGGEETAILGAARMVIDGLLADGEGLERVRERRAANAG